MLLPTLFDAINTVRCMLAEDIHRTSYAELTLQSATETDWKLDLLGAINAFTPKIDEDDDEEEEMPH